MQFVLSVDLDQIPTRTDAELARILRYWADTLEADDLTLGSGMNVYDSTFQRVGAWRVAGAPTAVASERQPHEEQAA